MQVTQTNSEGLKREFKVVVPASDIEQKVEIRLQELGKEVKLPGFRPGKVPMPILRKKYQQAVMGEVLELAVNDGAQKAIEGNDLRPAMQPKIEITSYAEGSDLEFTMAIEIFPEIKPMDFSTLELERPKAEAPQAEVDEALTRIAERQRKTEPAAEGHAAETGDIAVIDFTGKLDGVEFDGGKAENYSLELGSGTFIPGFEDQVVGAKKGEARTLKVTFPADYGAENLAGKDVEFDIVVRDLLKKLPAQVDDDLAKAVGKENVDELKSAVRQDLEREYEFFSRLHLKRALLDKLSAGHDFPVPAGMVEAEFSAIWKQVEEDKKNGRLDESDQAKSDEDLEAEYRGISERRVKLGLLLSEVARQNNLTLTQEDMNRGILAEARRYPGQEHLVFQYYQRNPQALEALKGPLFEDKVIDFILELAKVTDKVVSVEELMKDPDAKDEADKPAKKSKAKKAEKTEDAAAEGEEAPKKKATKKKAEKAEE